MGFIVSASDLLDGSPRYLSSERTWSTSLDQADVYETRAEADLQREAVVVQEGVVCDPFITKVKQASGMTHPVSSRDRIRSDGARALLERLGYTQAAEEVG